MFYYPMRAGTAFWLKRKEIVDPAAGLPARIPAKAVFRTDHVRNGGIKSLEGRRSTCAIWMAWLYVKLVGESGGILTRWIGDLWRRLPPLPTRRCCIRAMAYPILTD